MPWLISLPKALATAKKVIKETTGGAAGQTYFNQVSFLQRAQVSSGADLAKFEAVRFIRDLARTSKAPALAQLASRMDSAMRLGAGSADPFAKVMQPQFCFISSASDL